MSAPHVAKVNHETLSGASGRRYALIEQIASGGFGAVYAAQDLATGRKVAVKRLHERLAQDAGITSRLENESNHVRGLRHPNLVAFLDRGRDPKDIPFIVMDWVEGRTVAERLANGPLPAREAASMACQILDGLAAAHAKGVVHRDIKPANLIVTPSGLVIAVDFGLAKGGTLDGVQASSVLIGTPAYMAPEQLDGSPRIDGRVDLYALGVTLVEMLTGKPPFAGPNWSDFIRQHVFEDPPDLGKLRPDLDSRLVAVVMRALAKRPDDRFHTAAEMRAALAPFTVPTRQTTSVAAAPAVSPRSQNYPDPAAPADTPRAPSHSPVSPLWIVGALILIGLIALSPLLASIH